MAARNRRSGAFALLRALAACVFLGLAASHAAAQAGKPAVERVDDAAITAEVKAALQRDPMFSGWRVDVRTVEGTVYLSGFVRSKSDKERASGIALDVRGVRAVENELIVRATRR